MRMTLALASVTTMMVAGPAFAQRERITCSETAQLLPGQTVSDSVSIKLLGGRPMEQGVQRTFSVSYTAWSFGATSPLVMNSVSLSRRWYVSQYGTPGMATGPVGPTFGADLRAPQGSTVPARMLVRFRNGKTLLGEMPGTARIGDVAASTGMANVFLRVSLPEAVANFSGALEVEIVGADDGRRLATASFQVSGFASTSWHRNRRSFGPVIDRAAGKITEIPAPCKRVRDYVSP